MTKRLGLYWFTNDLRLHDQPALANAARSVDALICYSQLGNAWSQESGRMTAPLGQARSQFLTQSLADLDSQLKGLDQRLWVSEKDALTVMSAIIRDQDVTDVFRSEHAGWFENQCWENLATQFPQLRFHTVATHTLFDESNLPFSVAEMPAGFNGVRRKLEKSQPLLPIDTITELPAVPESVKALDDLLDWVVLPDLDADTLEETYHGGEQSGLSHLASYLNSGAASTYKQTRNALAGWDTSCKFSPWLAFGCLSARKVVADIKAYEAEHGANDSTYWVYVELLWREYFQWYTHRNGARFYQYGGPDNKPLTHDHDPQRIEQWIMGETDFPLVNACMIELRLTGFLSNRGRQIVASCLVNELAQDWRFGAAYFEQVLIDFDVATNWGNWQYIAGAGPANVNKKHFNLDKQTHQFDPQQRYINHWLSQKADV